MLQCIDNREQELKNIGINSAENMIAAVGPSADAGDKTLQSQDPANRSFSSRQAGPGSCDRKQKPANEEITSTTVIKKEFVARIYRETGLICEA